MELTLTLRILWEYCRIRKCTELQTYYMEGLKLWEQMTKEEVLLDHLHAVKRYRRSGDRGTQFVLPERKRCHCK